MFKRTLVAIAVENALKDPFFYQENKILPDMEDEEDFPEAA